MSEERVESLWITAVFTGWFVEIHVILILLLFYFGIASGFGEIMFCSILQGHFLEGCCSFDMCFAKRLLAIVVS